MRTPLALAFAAPMLLALPAAAQSLAPGQKPDADDEPAYVEAPPPGAKPHGAKGGDHKGLFLRLSVGVGGGGVSEDRGSSQLAQSGGAGLYSFAIGGGVSPNVALSADFFGFNVRDPRTEWAGTIYEARNQSVGIGGLGFNATGYFMPSNVYLSGTVGVVRVMRSTWSGGVGNSKMTTEQGAGGLGVSLMVGKEWRVAKEWGLGVAGQLILASTAKEENGDDVRGGASALGVCFSATYF